MDHKPVLLNELVSYLNLKDESVILDCTAGRGGHIDGILAKTKNSKIIAVDKDKSNIDYLKTKYSINKPGFNLVAGNSLALVHSDYKFVSDIIAYYQIEKLDAVFMDLGFCSTQIQDAKRGFSFMADGILDMRYDVRSKLTASYIVNNYSFEELRDIFFKYGEEKFSNAIASNILKQRLLKPIETTFELKNIVHSSISKKIINKSKTEPSTKIFQALRIEVNSEFQSLELCLNELPLLLNKEARLCIISFHSLEDRIVKKTLEAYLGACTCPPDFPVCNCSKEKFLLKKVLKKPIIPSEEEIFDNRKARSSKLRVYERI